MSIGLPVYNGADLLAGALDSLVGQDFGDFELVISDNASTDQTGTICREYASRDPRIAYHRSDSNRGAVWNFNRVFELSRGDYFMWAAHDDLWDLSFVRRCVEVLELDSCVAVCYSLGQPFLRNGQAIGEPYVGDVTEATPERRWHTVLRNWSLCSAIYGVIRRSTIARTRLLQSSLAADLIFIAEVSVHGTILQIPERLQWKRVPDPEQGYHTPSSMMEYLGASHGSSALLRLRALRELLRGLRHAALPRETERRMARDVVSAYLSQGHWHIDLKEYASTFLPAWRR